VLWGHQGPLWGLAEASPRKEIAEGLPGQDGTGLAQVWLGGKVSPPLCDTVCKSHSSASFLTGAPVKSLYRPGLAHAPLWAWFPGAQPGLLGPGSPEGSGWGVGCKICRV
jgi:hypothetical protein